MTTKSYENSIKKRIINNESNNKNSKPNSNIIQHNKHNHNHHSHNSSEEVSNLMNSFMNLNDKGSIVTLIGLGSNVGLTLIKAIAGVWLNSAALLADAVHSGSDLLADIVTLSSYTISRKPVNSSYPHGYGKYESLGSLVVAFLLIATAFGLGLHSFHLLLHNVTSMTSINPYLLQKLAQLPQGHVHGEEIVDARAMYFAALSMLVKEILYRITFKVAEEQHSNVLIANAMHHRSDAFGSLVALLAIGGSWLGYSILDPVGGLFVSGMILKNGVDVGFTSLKELVDYCSDSSISERIFQVISILREPTLPPLSNAVLLPHNPSVDLTSSPTPSKLLIQNIESVRIFSSGPSLFIDIHITLAKNTTLLEASEVEKEVEKACIEEIGSGKVLKISVRTSASRI